MGKLLSFITGYGNYILLALALSIGIGMGYKVRDILADRTEAQLSKQLSDYKAEVATDTAQANQRALDLIHEWSDQVQALQAKAEGLRKERNLASQKLTEGLTNAKAESDSTLSPAVRDYVDRLRNYQQHAR
jgi:seryl-tRNA synthetase